MKLCIKELGYKPSWFIVPQTQMAAKESETTKSDYVVLV